MVLEDALFPDARNIADGRFNNHFHATQFNSKERCQNDLPRIGTLLSSGMATDKTLCIGYGLRTDNISWALKKDVSVGPSRLNQYTIHKAFEYYKDSFLGSENDRRENQAKLFVSIGHLIHLIQDLHSPAHVRDGAHPLGDYLEIYGRHDGGFLLRKGKFEKSNTNLSILSAVSSIDINNIMLTQNQYASYQDFFTKEAQWTSDNFFSEAHNNMTEATDNNSGAGLDFDNLFDKDTIFDGKNTYPDVSGTIKVPIPNAEKGLGNVDKWFYIKNTTNNSTKNTVALVENGYLPHAFQSESMLAVVNPLNSTKSYSHFDKTALEDTAINVIPRAVASSQAFINYFFRGRIEASLNLEDANGARNVDTITIKNISDKDLVSNEELLTFKAGAKLTISYLKSDSPDQEIETLTTITLPIDLLVGEEYEIEGIKNLFSAAGVVINNRDKVLVLLDGQIGEDTGLDDYNINARGLAVAYAKSPRRLKKTGQSTSFTNFDDGWYQKGVNHVYTQVIDSELNDFVYDHVTGLSWLDEDLQKMSWSDANDYCTNQGSIFVNGSEHQWRLPNIMELLSLGDFEHYSLFFSSVSASNGNYHVAKNISVNVTNGVSRGMGINVDNHEHVARCTAGNEIPVAQLERDDEEKIVKDRSTGLMWQDNIDYDNELDPMFWYETIEYCEVLNLGGYHDWRAPNLVELRSLIDEGFNGLSVFQYSIPSINISSTGRSSIQKWSHSFYGGSGNMNIGIDVWSDETQGYIWKPVKSFYPRCVR